jgi:hypothetical protein
VASIPAPLLCISANNGGSIIVVCDTGACGLDRYWSANLYCCVLAVVAGFGRVALFGCYEGNCGLKGKVKCWYLCDNQHFIFY